MSAAEQQLRTRSAVWEVAGLIVLTSALITPTMLQLFQKWQPEDPENVLGHGWLVVAVAVWGLLRDARALPVLQPWRARVWPIAATVAVSLAWALARQGAVAGVQQLLWPLLLLCVFWVAFGSAAARRLFRPLRLLWFALPLWTLLLGVLWFTSTHAVKIILNVVGIPVHFDGNVISLPDGQIEIAAGCAGLAFFTAAVACGAIIGYLNRATVRQHVVLIGFAGLTAMVCNWIRISWIVVQAHRTQMQTPLITVSHYAFGWTVFAIGLLAYCLLFGRYGLRAEPAELLTIDNEVLPGAVTAAARPKVALLALLCAAAGPVAVLTSPSATGSGTPARVLPTHIADWRALPSNDSVRWRPRFPEADESALFAATDGANSLVLYANVYRDQEGTRKLASSGNSLLPNEHWQISRTSRANGSAYLIAEDGRKQRWLVRYVYVTASAHFARAAFSQLDYAVRRFWSLPAAGFVALADRCTADCQDAQKRVDAQWASTAAPFIALIQRASR